MEKTELGLDENIEGALAYFLGFISGIALIAIEKDNKFVKFHAIQSTGTFIILLVLNIFMGMLQSIPYAGWIFSIMNSLLILAEFALWLFLMYEAYNHERFKLPIIGEIAEKNST